MKQQCLESAFRRTRQRMPEGAAILSRHRQSKLCQCRTVSRCDLYNDGFLPAPWLASFPLFFNDRFCRIWLADGWHIGMSRKGTCILSYQFPFFDGRKGQAPRRVELDCAGFKPTRGTDSPVRQNLRINRRSANISLLDPWQISTMLIHRWVLSYQLTFGVGKTRASPVDKRTTGMPSKQAVTPSWICERKSVTLSLRTGRSASGDVMKVRLPGVALIHVHGLECRRGEAGKERCKDGEWKASCIKLDRDIQASQGGCRPGIGTNRSSFRRRPSS